MVGGMPASVVAWKNNGDYVLCQEELSDIAQSYFDDFSKYSTKISPRILRLTFQSVIQQMGKKFVYSHVEGNYHTEQIKEALDLLCDAGLVYRVQHTAANGLPFEEFALFHGEETSILCNPQFTREFCTFGR